jgi:NTE family protein
MSMSIPIFFEPVRWPNRQTGEEHLIVDGGMLSNFPVWLFDSPEPQWPTFGMKLVQEPEAPIGDELTGPVPSGGALQVIGYLRSLVDTMMAAHDRLYIDQHDFDRRTIGIDTLGVGTTEFDLSQERALALYESGRAAAEKFLAQSQKEQPA